MPLEPPQLRPGARYLRSLGQPEIRLRLLGVERLRRHRAAYYSSNGRHYYFCAVSPSTLPESLVRDSRAKLESNNSGSTADWCPARGLSERLSTGTRLVGLRAHTIYVPESEYCSTSAKIVFECFVQTLLDSGCSKCQSVKLIWLLNIKPTTIQQSVFRCRTSRQ